MSDAARPLQGEPSRIWDARTGRVLVNPAPMAITVASVGNTDKRVDDNGLAQRSASVSPRTGSPTTMHTSPPRTVAIHPTAVLRGHARAVSALEWSHDGRRLASGSVDGTVMIWDAWGSV